MTETTPKPNRTLVIVVLLLLIGLGGLLVSYQQPAPTKPTNAGGGAIAGKDGSPPPTNTDQKPVAAAGNTAPDDNVPPPANTTSNSAGNENAPTDDATSDNQAPRGRAQVRIVGRVVDRYGDPVVGMPVMLSPEGFITGDFGGVDCISVNRSNPNAVTDSDGRYQLDVDPHRTFFLMLAQHGVHAHGIRQRFNAPAVGNTLDLGEILAPERGDLDGVVTAPDGQSIAGASVSLQAANPSPFPGIAYGTNDQAWLARFLGPDMQLTSDEAGRFSIGLPPGDYRLEVSAPGWMTARQPVTLREGMREALQVRLDPAFAANITVTDDQDQPIADALVYAALIDGPQSHDAYRIERLDPYPGTSRRFYAEHPIRDVIRGATTSARGEATLPAIGEARVQLWVMCPGYATFSQHLEAGGYAELNRTIQLQPSTRIIGEIREGGKPISWLDTENYSRDGQMCAITVHGVQANGDATNIRGAWIALDGSVFTIDGLPANADYRIDIRIGSSLASVRVHAGPPPDQRLEPIELE